MSLRTRSKRSKDYEAEIDALRPDLDERSQGRCESGLPGCYGATVPHHRMRRPDGPNTMDNLLMLCLGHHSMVHNNPSWSYDNGLLVRKWDEIRPYEAR